MDTAQQYEKTYSEADPRFAEWRAMGGRLKAQRVMRLLADAQVGSLVEIGCGDGALLAEFARAGFGGSLAGYEIAESAVGRARNRGVAKVERFDGRKIPAADGAFDLAVLSHVLEHTEEPTRLLAEAGRVAGIVVLEVPLEDTILSYRRAYREAAERIGHIQKWSLNAARRIVRSAGMTIDDELLNGKTRAGRLFWADSPQARLKAEIAYAASCALTLVPPLGRRILPVDYTCRCHANQR